MDRAGLCGGGVVGVSSVGSELLYATMVGRRLFLRHMWSWVVSQLSFPTPAPSPQWWDRDMGEMVCVWFVVVVLGSLAPHSCLWDRTRFASVHSTHNSFLCLYTTPTLLPAHLLPSLLIPHPLPSYTASGSMSFLPHALLPYSSLSSFLYVYPAFSCVPLHLSVSGSSSSPSACSCPFVHSPKKLHSSPRLFSTPPVLRYLSSLWLGILLRRAGTSALPSSDESAKRRKKAF